MSKSLKRTLISVSCVIALLGSFVLIWYFGDNYGDFYNIAVAEFEIAGLDEGFIPQGLTYEEGSDTYLSCGYMNDGSASRVYVIDGETLSTTKYITLQDSEAQDYTGHAGGITTDGENVWISGDGLVYRFSYQNITTAENADKIAIIDKFESQNGADFLTIENGNLWVGEFHKEGKYDRPESHQFKTSDGEINYALSFCYEINPSNDYGLQSITPIRALSTGSLVQGMVITEDKIILSTSYSLPNSKLTSYENILSQTPISTFEINNSTIDVYVLETSNKLEEIELPCMSEEIVVANGKIYISFESACQKYKIVTREQINKIYSIALENL